MKWETLDAIRAHAISEYPRECCGLVAVIKGHERYVPCSNHATKKGTDHFILPGDEYAAVEERGDIMALVHSHPDELEARPSPGDRVACEASKLPWLIVAVARDADDMVHAGEIHRMRPEGYVAPLVGRAWQHGVLDCYALCRDWYAREWGLVLPDFTRTDEWWNDGRSNLYLEHFRECGFAPIEKPEWPGDAILMQVNAANDVPNHAAIYLGDSRMLHHYYGRLSCRTVYGGMWRDYTRLVIRHETAAARMQR